MIGATTLAADDPLLTVRLPGLPVRPPVRIVVAGRALMAGGRRLFASLGAGPVWLIVAEGTTTPRDLPADVEVVRVAPGAQGRPDPKAILAELGERGLTSVLVEGGARLAGALVRAGLVDRIAWFRAATVLGGDGIPVLDPLGVAEPGAGPNCVWKGIAVNCGPKGLPTDTNLLFHNDGGGTFSDISDRSGVARVVGRYSMTALAADLDGDGWQDIYVAADSTAAILYRNNRDGTFTDVAIESGTAFSEHGSPQAGMGVDVSDYDHDGLLDITVTNFSHDYNAIFRNLSRARASGGRTAVFEDVSVQVGVVPPTFHDLGWAASWTDFDNDGDRDLFYANGHVYGEIDNFASSGTSYRQSNRMLENLGGRSPVFRDATERLGAGLRVKEVHRGGAAADLDDDGDEDQVVCVLNGTAYILRNDGGNRNNWISVWLRGTKANGSGIGAVVTVQSAQGTQRQMVRSGSSYCSQSDLALTFGLGRDTAAMVVEVEWPGGAKERVENVPAKSFVTITEGKGRTK